MKFDFSNTRIFIKPGITDLRTSTDSLLYLIKDIMKQDPLSGAVFLFCNKNKTILKAIWWDRNGFWIAQKKLEKSKWPWPNNKKELQELNITEIKLLLMGIDFSKKHEEVSYKYF